MRAVLLAAGAATRLRPLTDDTPKCLLEVGGKTILARTLELLFARDIRRCTIVDGFRGDRIRQSVAGQFGEDWLGFVRNERYAETNNAYSLMLARDHGSERLLLMDGDVLFEPAVLDRMLEAEPPNRLLYRSRGTLGDEEMKVVLDDQQRVVALSKELDPARAAGESLGIEIFSASFANALFHTLERRMLQEQRLDEYYEASFEELLRRGEEIVGVDLGELCSMEVDTVDDLERARALFC